MARVTVEPDLVRRLLGPAGWGGSPQFLVRAADVEGAAAALHAASSRLITVDEEGEELEDWANTGETYTPNFVSDVHLAPEGPWLTTDTKGELYPPMVETMARLIVEELERRGVDAHVTVPGPDLDRSRTWQPPEPPPRGPEPEPAMAWYVRRGVRRVTTTGRTWEDDEYFCNDGTWTRDRRLALLLPEAPPRELVRALAADKPDTEQHRFCSVYGVRQRVDGWERPGSKPPPELRRDD